MTGEKVRISGSEAPLLMMGFLFGSSLLLPPGQEAGRDAWIATLLGIGEGLAFTMIIAGLLRRFPGKTLVGIVDIVYGPILGRLISLGFVLYLLHLCSLVLNNFLDFIKINLLQNTPEAIILLFGVLICAYAARHGVEVLGRLSQVLVPITVLLILVITVLLIPQIELINIQPILNTPWPKIFKAAHGAAMFPFGEIVAFVMIAGFINRPQEIPGSMIRAVAIGGFFLAFIELRNAAILGESARIFFYPAFYVGRLVDLADVFTRVEIIVALNFLTMGFLKIAVLLYGISKGVSEIVGIGTHRSLVIPVAILAILLAMNNFSNVLENIIFARDVYPFFALPFIMGIPLTTLIVAVARDLPKKKGAAP